MSSEDIQSPSAHEAATQYLEQVVEEFRWWQKATKDIYHENQLVSSELSVLQKRCLAYEQALKTASEDIHQLHSTISRLQGIVASRCDLEDENVVLKDQLETLKEEARKTDQQHSEHMAETAKNLREIQEAHKNEIMHLNESSNQQLKKEVESLQKVIQDKTTEIRQLHTQLSEAEKDKHTEIVKLRLEYDAKLLKIQKQSNKTQAAQSSVVNSDIFRRKLQHAKAESEKEIISLRKRVGDLERQLSSTNKRRKM